MDLLSLAWVFAIAGAAIGLGELIYFADGYLPHQVAAIALWVGIPMPAAAWFGVRLVRSPAGARMLATGLGVALALGLFGLWDVTVGPGKDESLSGLIVITMPAYQIAFLASTLMALWLMAKRHVSTSASDGSTDRDGGRA